MYYVTQIQITYVDFVLYELLDQHRLFESSLLNGVDNLKVVENCNGNLSHMTCMVIIKSC